MKKRVYLFSILFISMILVLQLVIAADVNVSDADDEDSKIDKAYECLEDKVEDNCDSLSLEEQIFSLLAIGECKSEVLDEAEGDNECWPSGNCDLKLTALAVLALDSAGTSTTNAEEWLFSQNEIPYNLDWFLEIENTEDETSCTVTYSDTSYDINIGNDKKLSSGAGSCLSLESHEYWLKVASNCYDLEFETSCDKSFLTTLLFKKDDSSTIHVSEEAHSASGEWGETTEIVNSLCFAEGSECNYEGSLWAALVLDYLDNDVSAYIPYLVTMADENEEYLPEAFLYLLTGYADFKNDLLLKQKSSKYWDESGDKFYDTALALYPFQSIEPLEKQNSKDWLLDVQGDSGCWNSENTRDTAFILYSLWPRGTGGGNSGPEDLDCEDAGFFCVSKINCDGSFKTDYECSGTFKCCTKPEYLETCDEQGGDRCNSVEECVGGMVQDASDLDIGEECCIGGSCQTPPEETECESYGGTCRSFDCDDSEIESDDDCEGGDICCVDSPTPPKKGGYWWIWLLLILIILLIVAIIFRDKLIPLWFKVKSKFRRGKPGPRAPTSAFPSNPSMMHPGRPMQRRILPPARRTPGRPQVRKPKGDIDDVLKKLKDMGK